MWAKLHTVADTYATVKVSLWLDFNAVNGNKYCMLSNLVKNLLTAMTTLFTPKQNIIEDIENIENITISVVS